MKTSTQLLLAAGIACTGFGSAFAADNWTSAAQQPTVEQCQMRMSMTPTERAQADSRNSAQRTDRMQSNDPNVNQQDGMSSNNMRSRDQACAEVMKQNGLQWRYNTNQPTSPMSSDPNFGEQDGMSPNNYPSPIRNTR